MFRKHKDPPPLTDLEKLEAEYVAAKEVYRKARGPREREKLAEVRARLIAARNEDRQFRVGLEIRAG